MIRPLSICKKLFLVVVLSISVITLFAADRYSVATGSWNVNSTWSATSGGASGASFPVAGDNVFIEGGFTVTITANAACANLNIANGSTLTIAGFNLTVSGTTSLSGTINYTSTTGTKIFTGLVTINVTGIWNNTTNNESITVRGGITNNGTFNAGTGTYTFDTSNQALTGTLSIPNVTVTGVTLTNNGTLTVSAALAGTGGLTQAVNTTLNLGGTSGITTLNATNSGNTVNYSGAAQTAKVSSYYNLTLSGSGIKTFATTPTVNAVLSMEGTATVVVTTGVVTYGANATLRYNTATARTASAEEWIVPFAATGGVIIANTGTITMNAPKVFNASVPLTINSGATLATNNLQLTFGGDFINGGSLSAGSSPIVITNTMAAQSINGFTTTGLVLLSKTAGTATFTGNVNGGGLTIDGVGGTLNLGSGLTHTFTGAWTRTNGTLDGSSSLLKIGGNVSGTGGTFTAGSGTVEWYAGGAQTCAGVTYNNLTLSGSGAKTVTGATVNGVLSLEGTATAAGTTPTYGSAATLQYKGSAAQTTGIEFPATFSSTGGIIINNTAGITLTGSVTISSILTLTNGAFIIGANKLTLSNGANLNYGSGSLTGSATSNLTIGTGTDITLNAISGGLNNFNTSRNITLGADLSLNGTLTLTAGTFTIGANTLTLNGPAIAGTPNNLSTTTSSTLVFGGSSAGIVIPSSVTNLNSLIVSNPNGISLSGPLSSGTLTFTSGILNTTSTNLLTITNTAAGSIGGSSATSYINGPLARTLLAAQNNYGTPYLFPVGDGADYRPLELLNITTGATPPVIIVSENGTGALTSDETTITSVAPRNWYLQVLSGNFTSAFVRLTESGLDFTKIIGQSAVQSGNYVSAGGTNIGTSITTASAVANASLPAYFAIGTSVVTTFYSYQSGNWNSSSTWTIDPSGTLWIGASVPGAADNVVILNGRNVTINENGKNSLSLEIKLGGTLDLQATNTHNFGTVSGQGSLRLSSGTFPGGVYTTFVAADGGTVEYYNYSGTLSTVQTTYNNVLLSKTDNNATNYTMTLASNLSLNGGLTLNRTQGTGTLTLTLGNNATALTVTINGNLTNNTGCWIGVGVFNAIHTINLYGDLTNYGTIRFTNRTLPWNNSWYNCANLTTTGAADMFFLGSTNNTVTCNGITDFHRFVVAKGTDQTYMLDVYSSNVSNFRLWAPNNYGPGASASAACGVSNWSPVSIWKNLYVANGTLKLNANITIPSLTEGGQDFNIVPTAQIWINGADVTTTTNLNGTGYTATTLAGTLRISSGSFSTGGSAGFVLGTGLTPTILVEGGTLDVSQIWTTGAGGTNISYIQSGGIVNVRAGGENHGGTFFELSRPECAFKMSGGTINFLNGQHSDNNWLTRIFDIRSDPGNIQVTGGTININLKANTYDIISSAPFYNLNITRASGVSILLINLNNTVSSSLSILHDLTINPNCELNSGAASVNLKVAGNFNLTGGGIYTTGTNTTTFNGSGGQVFSNTGTITTGLNNFFLENASNTNITNNLTIRGALTINNSCFLNDQGNTISVAGNISNSGTHTSQANGSIILNGTGVQTIGGSGSGLFGNFAINKTAGTSSFSSKQSITGNLRLVSGILDINTCNLALSANSNIYDVLNGTPAPTTFGNTKMITTTGQQSDGGLTKTFNTTGSFLYPVGAGTAYHPGTISLNQAPATWGDVTVKPVASPHPLGIQGFEIMTYYWKVTSNLITGIQPGSVSNTFKYVAADVGAQINSYVTGVFNPYFWTRGAEAQVDKINRNILFPGIDILDGDYTAGTPVALGGITVFYSHRSGDWDTPGTWSNVSNEPASPDALTVPGSDDAAVIGDGLSNNHVVTISANGKSTGTLQITSGSVLDLKTTTGHNFVVLPDLRVKGTGTLRLASGTFPSGDFGFFLGPDGGTVEYYTETAPSNIGAAFTVPSSYISNSTTIDLTNYCNLVLSPATGKNITLPNIDLTLHKDFKVSVSGTSVTGIAQLNNQNTTRTLTINGNLIVNNGNLRYMNGVSTAQNIIVNGNVTVASGAIFDVAPTLAATNTLSIQGDLTNNGIFDMIAGGTQICNVTFTGAANKQIKGTTAVRTEFNILTVNKGTDRNSILETTVNAFSLNTSLATALTISNGTFRLSAPLTITLTTSSPFTIPFSGCLSANTGTINIGAANNNAADLILQGRLEVMNTAVVNIGNGSGSNNDIEYAAAGNPEINISGGSLNVDGQIRRNASNTLGSLWFNQSGGTITIKANNLNTSRGSFEVVNSGSKITLTGGNLIILKAGSTTYADLLITPESSTVNNSNGGHTLTIGDGTTPASQNFKLNASAPLWNLTIDGTTQNKTATLSVTTLSVLNNLTINGNGSAGTGSVFKANELNVTIGGSLTNNNLSASVGASKGGYQAGADGSTQTTTFTGTGTITGSGSNLTNFANLVIGSSSTTPSFALGLNSNIMVNNNLTLESGTLSDAGNTITVLGDISNSATHTSPSTPGGGIVLASGNEQNISGNGNGSFGNITINNASGVNLTGNIRITRKLNLALGKIYIDDYKLIMDVDASFNGPFDEKHMIESNGVLSDRGVQKYFSGSATGFIFPVGSNNKYCPVTFTITSSDAGSINVVPVGLQHPADFNPTGDQLNYYWKVLTTGFSGLTFSSQVYKYDNSFIKGHEVDYHGALYHDYAWTDYGTTVINTSENTITINRSDLIAGEYTAGEVANFTLFHKLYSLKSGNWNDGTVWAEDLPTNPSCGYYPNGNPVFIQPGHVITMNINNAHAYSVNIEGTFDLGVTTFHNLGYIMDTLHAGTGKMRLQATSDGMFLFPGGNYDAFMASPDATVELYGTTNASLPLKPGNIYKPYQNLILTGSGIKYMSAENLKILGNLTINNLAKLNNTLYNKNLYILQNWTDLSAISAGFIPGTGLASFEGNSAQTLTVTNAISESFYNLRMNNPAGLTISGGGRIQVSGILTLNNGVITTNATNSLTIINASTSAVSSGSVNSFINGPLYKQISNGSYFMFPVGKTGTPSRYGNVFLSDITTAGIWEAEYYNALPPYDITIKKPPISYVSNNEYWRVNGVAGGSGNVQLRWDASSGYAGSSSSTRSKIRIVEWNPSGTPSAQWEYRGKILNDGGDISGTVTTDNPISLAPGTNMHYLTIGNEGLPTANITSPLTATICNDGLTSTTVVVALTGTPPWSLAYRLGATLTTLNNIASSPASIVLTSNSSGITQPINTPTVFNFNITNINDFSGLPGTEDYITTVAITVNPVPDNTITGKTLVGTGEMVTYSTPADANTYAWSLSSNGTPLTGNTANYTVTWGVGTPGPYTIYLIKTAANGCQATKSIQVTTSTTPTPVITGNQFACAGSSGQVYSTPNVAGHDYTWTISPAGAGNITSGAGTNSITVTWNGASSGNSVNVREHVTSSGLPGIFTDATLPVDIGIQPSAVTPSYSAPVTVCNGFTASVTLNNSQSGVRYQIRRNSDNSNIGAPVDGNGGTITLITTTLTSTTAYYIYAYTLPPFNCSAQLSNPSLTFTVSVLPVLNYGTLSSGDQSICSVDLPNNISFSTLPSGGAGTFTYQWYSYTGLAGSCPSGTIIPGGWTLIALATSDNYSPSVLTISMSYAVMVTPTGSPVCGSATWAGGCRKVTVTPLSVATFNYSGTPYCQFEPNPSPTFSGGGVAGTFSAGPGLVFVSTSTGEVDLLASTPGTYTVANTIAATGGCAVVTATSPITIISGLAWTGAVSTNWNDPGNWSCGFIPDMTILVHIPNVTNKPVLSSGAVGAVNNITIEPGSSLVISGNTLQISGTITNNGTIDASDATILMNGSSVQSIPAGAFAANTIENLTINNSSGVTLLGPLNITGIMKVQTGSLLSGGFLTLISSATKTALIDGSGSGTITGNVTMQRYLPMGFGYKYISSPFQASTVGELADDIDLGGFFPTLYGFDESSINSGWISYITPANILSPLQGYAANFGSSGSPFTADITGVVNNGILSATLYNHNNTFTTGFNLIGNPYPSPIDWDAPLGWSKANIDDALYYFKSSTTDEYGGTYSTYINGVSSDGLATSIIPSMQGFFIHVADGSYPVTGTLSMDNRIRINDLTHPFVKSGEVTSESLIRLTAEFSDDNASVDPVVIYFTAKAAPGFDSELDALKLYNTDYFVPSLYAIGSDGKKLSIDALPLITDTISSIPLGIYVEREGTIVFRLRNSYPDQDITKISITDKDKGIEQDLGDNGKYSVDLGYGEYLNRFYLNLRSSPTGIPEVPAQSELFTAYCSHGILKIFINLDQGRKGTLYISNITGQLLDSREIKSSGHYEFNPGFSNSIYIITFATGNRRSSKKLFYHNQ